MAQGFLVPQGTFVNSKINQSSNATFVNVPLNVTAVIMTFVKGQNSQMRKEGYHWSIDFYVSQKDLGAVWIYPTKEARDADYDRLIGVDFFKDDNPNNDPAQPTTP